MSRLENIQNSFKSIQAKTKAFFHGDRWKEVLVFFFFALLAFGFWLLQSLQQEYEIELVFPVKYKNVPADLPFTYLNRTIFLLRILHVHFNRSKRSSKSIVE